MIQQLRIVPMFIVIMLIIGGCKDDIGVNQPQPDETQISPTPSATEPQPSATTVTKREQKDNLSSLFDLQLCQEKHPDMKALNVTFSLPEQQQHELKGIQAISVRKLYDDAGYGYRFGGSFALNREGRVYAWGLRFGEWWHGSSSYPRLVTGLPKIKHIAGEFALTPDGNVWFMNGSKPPFAIKGLSGVTSISEIGNDVLAAITNDGQLWIWWPEMDGRKETLRRIDKAGQVKAGYGDMYSMYWIDSEGKVWHAAVDWQPTVSEPQLIPLPDGEKAKQVHSTFAEDFIMTTNNKIYQISFDLKVELTALQQVEKIAGVNGRLLFLKPDGTVWEKYLDGLPAEKEPMQINGLKNIVDIQAWSDHALALSADGTVYSWGSNMYGQLGRYPHFFERFTPIGKLKGIQDVQTYTDEIRIIHEGDVWKINNRMEVEPVLLNHQTVKLLMDEYLLADGTLLLNQGPEQCYQLHAKEPIRDIVRDGNGWITKLDSGTLYKVELQRSVKKVQFPGNQQPRIKQLFGYPFFTISIYTQYRYPLEGPGSFRHVLIGKDGTLMIYGHSPFFRYDDKPSPVLITDM